LYGCESSFPALRDEEGPRIFESRSLTIVIRLKGKEVTRDWRPQNEELHDLFSSIIPTVIELKSVRWAGHAARKEAKLYVHRVLVGRMKDRDSLEESRVDGRIIQSNPVITTSV
jgi:hypothetical protein